MITKRWFAMAAVLGGVLMAVGAVLPWFSLFAGLHPYPGTTGANGWILVGAGLLSVAGGIILWIRADTRLSWGLGAIGSASLLFAMWIGVGLLGTYQSMLSNPMMVPRLGPGLAVAAVGAVLVSLTPWLPRRA